MNRKEHKSEQKREVQGLSPRVKEYFKLDNAARTWWNTEGHPRYERQIQLVAEKIDAAGKRILDIATGRGRFAIQYAKQGADVVLAMDISNGMLEIARENARRAGVDDRIEFMCADIEESNLERGTFDVVNCMEVYVHFPNPRKVTRKIMDSLVPGGVLVANIDLPVTRKRYFGWINEPLRSLLSLPVLYNLTLFSYFRVLPQSARRLLHRKFRLPLEWHNPVRFACSVAKKRLATAAESIDALAKEPGLRLSRPKDAINLMELETFAGMLVQEGFHIVEVIREGRSLQLPYGYIIIARKADSPRA